MQKARLLIAALLESFGLLWFLVESTTYFGAPTYGERIRSLWWAFLLCGGLIALYRICPKKRFIFLLNKRDVTIEIVIGDIFRESGPIIVGSNITFETHPATISPSSIQGAFTGRYCSDLKALNDQIAAQAPARPVPYGGTITVKGSGGKIGYFCAVSELNHAGVAQSTIEDLRNALGGLWNYLATNTEKAVINIPVLGSGFSRITASREELMREIILSFLAAISERAFCDGIRLVIHPKDIEKYKIDVEEFVRFTEYNVKYALSRPSSSGAGNPEP